MWVHFLQKGKFEGGTSCLSCISLCIYYVYEYRDFLWYIHLDQTDLKVTAAGDGESPKNLKQRQDQLLHLEGCCGSNKNRFKGQGHLGDAFRNPGKGYRFENEMIDKFDDSSLLSTCTVTILAWPSSFLLSPTPDSSSYLCSWPSSIHPSHQTERHIWQSRSPAYNTSGTTYCSTPQSFCPASVPASPFWPHFLHIPCRSLPPYFGIRHPLCWK